MVSFYSQRIASMIVSARTSMHTSSLPPVRHNTKCMISMRALSRANHHNVEDGLNQEWDGPHMTLERAIGDKAGSDNETFQHGLFDGCVYPDLPLVGSSMADGIESCIISQVQETLREGQKSTNTRPLWVARTIAAQCLDKNHINEKILRSGNLFRASTQKNVRGAFLCVSGADPSRMLPFVKETVKDGIYILNQARYMRQQGDIPESVALWSVGNPMTDPVSSVHRKVDAGAQVILTQPPFFQYASESWFQSLEDIPARILAGVPIITSPRNLSFWCGLCRVDGSPEAQALQETFPVKSMTENTSEYEDRVIRWNRQFIEGYVLQLPAISGIHVMPVTQTGLRLMKSILP